MAFKVTVIIPVYNAAQFVRKSVESAVHLDEVGEVIVVEDASPDNALEVCIALEREYDKVKLLRHPNGENRGAGASRNLGIEHASYEFIAFLDADDYYLPNRFKKDQELFKDINVDGVYSAALNIHIRDINFRHIQTVNKAIKSKLLFYYLIRGTYGHFCTNGITLRSSFLKRIGGFKINLKLHQDTELWLRCAFSGNLIAGSIVEPTSVILSHGGNRIATGSKKTRIQFLLSLLEEFSVQELGVVNYMLLIRKTIKNITNKHDFLQMVQCVKLFKTSS